MRRGKCIVRIQRGEITETLERGSDSRKRKKV